MDILRFFSKYFWIVYIILVTILCFFLSKSVVFLIDRSLKVPLIKETNIIKVKESQKPRHSLDDYKIIFERNLFNVSGQEQVLKKRGKEILNPAEIPISKSGMELLGTFVGSPPKLSIALIKADGEVGAYHTDEKFKGTTILNINRREVIIERGGMIEKLVMEEAGKPMVVKELPKPLGTVGRGLEGIQQTANNKWIIDRKKVPIKDINTFMKQCRLVPHSVDGKPAGFKITGILKGSIIDKIGLLEGDIIKKVNNDEIKTPDDAYKAYQRLQTDNKIVLDIERNGTMTPLTYEVKN